MARPLPQSALRYPLSIALGSEANVRVLRELCSQGGPMAAIALAERTRLAKASVSSSLADLRGLGVVTAAGSHRTHLWHVDHGHPMVPALELMFRAEAGRWLDIEAAITATARAMMPRGVLAVWLYGSVARGEDAAASDLDLAIVTDEADLAPVLQEFRDALIAPARRLRFDPAVVGVSADDVARLQAEQDPWWTAVKRDARALLGPRPDDVLRHRGVGGRAAA